MRSGLLLMLVVLMWMQRTGIDAKRWCPPSRSLPELFAVFPLPVGASGNHEIAERRQTSTFSKLQRPKLRLAPRHLELTKPTTLAEAANMFSRQALLRSARAAAPQRPLLTQVRTFAAPAADQKVKPPVSLFGLDGTYATALVRLSPAHTGMPNWWWLFSGYQKEDLSWGD
jgi:hypothetical protein